LAMTPDIITKVMLLSLVLNFPKNQSSLNWN
jgi:hypothetical protein